ncbi:UDP-N-acetylmuramoyl-tripeptide--D-alanyl-D-alanine ligase [Planococcus lenghuensis]|uniref:UDP-N-acetylmuramoyl-tripeptide--D-alanyl-D-alanine ligase n=1 Tax=Planococcus lenghuensis TaxID=2213202 RepID=A0A1Q2KV86_9BACL|nr:UDP-N-acetylmuramoyl-tripeptide--D-alanyl-D-alanine ligase [Planococcus lenghuensis]AQQ52135.1 UDP-N-acetylmuramoylalanyl-D-glutamate--2,6-diaminopimelate ligase [Planococcus lenghuensis]
MNKSVQQVADWLGIETQQWKDIRIKGVSINTRTLKPGELFIPFRGEHVNGHRFVRQAIELGAGASLWQRDEPDPPQGLPLLFVDDCEKALQQMARAYRQELKGTIVGITGSNGKTSTKDLVASVLAPYFKVEKTQGNLNNQLGLPLTILSLDEEVEFAILEMGMSAFGEIEFLSELARPDYAIITNIGEAHMQDLGSREGIARAKFEITAGLSRQGKLFYDGDEPLLQPYVENWTQAVSFGFGDDNELTITSVEATENGSEFSVSGVIDAAFTIPVLGRHQIKNALPAILLALDTGLEEEDIRRALKKATLTDMRMQPVRAENGTVFINDAYNAAPTSMKAALQFLGEIKMKPEKWVVLGDMLELGEQERAYHEELASQLPEGLRGVLLYGPRMKWLHDELKETFNGELMWSEEDLEPLIGKLESDLSPDSLVLVKGSRGMELERIIEPLTASK